MVLDANAMSKKNWKRAAAGIWRNKSGTLYERPKVDGRWTYRSLETEDLEVGKTRFHQRRAGVEEKLQLAPAQATQAETVLVGHVIQKYQQDGYRDRQRQQRPELTRTAEEGYCEMLLGFWEHVPVHDVTIAACDRYHTWRKARLTRGTGNRIVDLELNALNNAFLWACRCELVRDNPLAVRRPRYTSARNIQHCRKFMPANADELHHVAKLLFERPDSAVLGWQVLVEGCTGLRTSEALKLRTDSAPFQPGWITPDRKSICVWRSKGQDGVNPFVAIDEGLAQILPALFRWKDDNHPDSPWFFPSPREPGAVVDKSALAHALVRIRPRLGRKITSHGLRAFYVTVRRSHGVSDPQIAWEIGHTSGGATLAEVYGGAPPHWLAGDGPKLSWSPKGVPAWLILRREPVAEGLC